MGDMRNRFPSRVPSPVTALLVAPLMSAAQTLAHRYGDCKDKAALLIALLAPDGIVGHMVLVGTHGESLPNPIHPSLANYNHAIAAFDLPAGRIYLDSTSLVGEVRHLRGDDQGRPALVVKRTGFERVVLPSTTASDNRVELRYHLRLGATGGASGKLTGTVRGEPDRLLRTALLYQPEKKRAKVLRGYVGAWDRAPDLTAERLEAFDEPLGIRGPFVGARVSSRADSLLLFQPERLVPAVIPDLPAGRRTASLSFGVPFSMSLRATLRAPPGYVLGRLPAPARLEGPYGRFLLAYRRLTPQEVELDLDYRRTVREAPASAYRQVRAFFRRALVALRRAVPMREGGER